MGIPGELASLYPTEEKLCRLGMHDNRSAGLFAFRRVTSNIKSIHDLGTIPDLVNAEGKELADAKTRANAQSITRARFLSAFLPFNFLRASCNCFGERAGHPIMLFLFKP